MGKHPEFSNQLMSKLPQILNQLMGKLCEKSVISDNENASSGLKSANGQAYYLKITKPANWQAQCIHIVMSANGKDPSGLKSANGQAYYLEISNQLIGKLCVQRM